MRYRRKPTEIEAIQWDGTDQACAAIEAMGAMFGWQGQITIPGPPPVPPAERVGKLLAGVNGASGWVTVPVGTWVARNEAGDDFWPIEQATFAATYEPVGDER